jgi:hypothetical protein
MPAKAGIQYAAASASHGGSGILGPRFRGDDGLWSWLGVEHHASARADDAALPTPGCHNNLCRPGTTACGGKPALPIIGRDFATPFSGPGAIAMNINLSAPTVAIFLASVVLAILALLGHFTVIQFVTMYKFWFAIVAYAALFAGCVFKGL